MKKRLLMLLMSACVITGAFAGCKGKDANVAQQDPGKANKNEKVELEFFSQKPETVKAMEAIIAKFREQNPNVTIKIVAPPSDARTVLTTRLSTNEMPDILNSYPAELFYKTMMNDGLLLELTGKAFLNNVSDSMLKLSAHEGKQYALPMTLSSYGIYYRTDIFEKQGLKAPKTYAELIDVCKKLKASGIQPFSFADKDVGNIGQRLERLIGVINNDTNSEFKKVASGELKESPSLNAFANLLVDLKQYGPAESLGMTHEASIAEIATGKAAMLISGTWVLGPIKTANPDAKVDLIPFPNPTGDKTLVPINIDTSFSIAQSCKNKEVAVKFLEFLSKPEIAQIYCDMEGTPNMIKGVNYNVPEHKYIKSFMDKGEIFLTQVNFWPTGLREELRVPAQKLIIDSDKAKFTSTTNEIVKKVYKAAK